MMKKVSIWLSAIRIRTLPLSISGIIIAGCLAEYKGVFNWPVFLLAIAATISYQILSNLANDLGDAQKGTDNEDRIGPTRAIQSGNISPKQMYNAIKFNILICVGLTIALIFFAFGLKHIILAFLFFFIAFLCVRAALKYTMGSNAYGYKALGDLYVFVFFGLVSVIGCYILFAKTFDYVVIIPAITVGLLSTAVLNLNNMRDIDGDTKANKITIAVKLGPVKAKLYHFFLVITAMVCALTFGLLYYVSAYNLLFLIAFLPLLLHLNRIKKIDNLKDYDPELKKLALSTVLLAILLGIGQLL